MQAHVQDFADRRDVPDRLVVARLTQAEARAVVERDEDAQALALIDDIADAVFVACKIDRSGSSRPKAE
jgi:hypothetical protein